MNSVDDVTVGQATVNTLWALGGMLIFGVALAAAGKLASWLRRRRQPR